MRFRDCFTPVLLLAACSGAPAPAPALPEDTGTVPLNKAWWTATHNSYWVDRGFDDPFGSGANLRLIDQLAGFGVRTVEIDIHRARGERGEFDVYHTFPGNSTCETLRVCLSELRAFGELLPEHEVIHVILEFKEINEPFFDALHTADDLDRVLRAELGETLYQPANLLRRCPGAPSMQACVATAGWPSVESLRGRFIVVMLGNWDELGASSTAAWALYATSGPMAGRAAFPMASSWMLNFAKLRPSVTKLITAAQFDRAFEQSPYLQIEDLSDPRIKPAVAANIIIRAGAADTLESQEAKLALGIQMLQTDFPWVRPGGLDRSRPLTPFGRIANLQEPGLHLEMQAPATTGVAVRWIRAPGITRVRASPSAGRSGRPVCLVTGTNDEWSGRCRSVNAAPGESRQAALRFHRVYCANGECTLTPDSTPHVGDRLEIESAEGRFGIASFYADSNTDPSVLAGIIAEGPLDQLQFEPGTPPLCDSPSHCF